jgi:sugar phosphate isomerase/epimerase
MSMLVDRRQFLIAGAMAAVGLPGTQSTQTFKIGIVPSGGARRGAGGGRTAGFLTSCDEVSALGLHYVEANTIAPAIAMEYAERFSEFKAEMDTRRLALAGGALWAHMADPAQRQELIAQHQALARFVAACGGEYITHLLAAGAGNGESDGPTYRQVNVKAFAANARDVGSRVFSETGIKLAYHPEQGEVAIGLHERILDAVDEQYFALLADVGHIAAGGVDPAALCARYRARLICVHLKDFRPSAAGAPPARSGNVSFGQGAVDFPAIIKVLRDTKFTGYVIGESGGSNEGMRDFMVNTLGLHM